jgi:hypothetical protein
VFEFFTIPKLYQEEGEELDIVMIKTENAERLKITRQKCSIASLDGGSLRRRFWIAFGIKMLER